MNRVHAARRPVVTTNAGNAGTEGATDATEDGVDQNNRLGGEGTIKTKDLYNHVFVGKLGVYNGLHEFSFGK